MKRKSALEANKPSQPVKAVRKRGVIVDPTRDYLEPNELLAFFQSMPKTSFWHSYFFIEYFRGCRLSEPALILDSEVSVKRKKITIKRLKKENEEEGFLACTYPADERELFAVSNAQKWKEVNKTTENPFVFASSRRRPTNEVGAERLSQLRNVNGWQAVSRFTAHRAFITVARLAKLPEELCNNHVLRHTRAAVMLARGATEENVMKALGHSSIKMTQRYVPIAEIIRPKITSALTDAGLDL